MVGVTRLGILRSPHLDGQAIKISFSLERVQSTRLMFRHCEIPKGSTGNHDRMVASVISQKGHAWVQPHCTRLSKKVVLIYCQAVSPLLRLHM